MSINCTVKKKKGGVHKIIWMRRHDLWLPLIFWGGDIKGAGVIVVVARLSCNKPAHFLDNRLVTLVPKVILLHYICL